MKYTKYTGALPYILVAMTVGCSSNLKPAYDDVYYGGEFTNPANLYFDVPFAVNIGIFSDESCTLGRKGTRIEFGELETAFSIGGYKPKNTVHSSMRWTKLEPNVPLVLGINLNDAHYDDEGKKLLTSCDFSLKYTPKENHDYVLTYEIKGKKCHISVLDITESNQNHRVITPEGIKKLDNICSVFKSYPIYELN